MKNDYNGLTTEQHIEVIEYLLSIGGKLVERNGHYDFHNDKYDSWVNFDELDGLRYDSYETSFYMNHKEVFAQEGNCGYLILNSLGDSVIEDEQKACTSYNIIRNTRFMLKRLKEEAANG